MLYEALSLFSYYSKARGGGSKAIARIILGA